MQNAVTLTTFQNGAAEEMFQGALSRVLENIDDPSTAAKGKRCITLVIAFEANDEDRRSAKVTVECHTKLARMKPLATMVAIGRSEGSLAAREMFTQEALNLQFPNPVGAPALVAPTTTPQAAAGGNA